jgi:D-beta-D-heptose 7-phosphate kinase/D-beta-D-heptose 1-phosphate adenosyltransferase
VIAVGWEEAPGLRGLREHALLLLPRLPASWEQVTRQQDIELPASVLIVKPELARLLSEEARGFFRSVVTAAGEADLRRAALAADRAALRSRVLTGIPAAARRCDAARRAGRSIVFTNGVFDMLHIGHVRLLQAARALGGFLVVGINSDESARRLKGRSRPVLPQFARAEMVAAVRGVDLCVIFDQPDPRSLLRKLRPSVLAKGSEYSLGGVVGRKLVEGWGGRVALVPHVRGWSATEVIRRARRA